jgi:peptide/nickel transport system permease protein
MSEFRPGRWSPNVWVGGSMLLAFIVLGAIGPWIAPHAVGTRAIDLDHMFAPMTWSHWLGTDKNGVDTVSQLCHGARAALILSSIVITISATIGVTVGMIAGYFRGIVDGAIMRVVDILLAFPGLLLNIAIVAVVARPGLPIFIAALCANGWVGFARVARGQVLSLRERDYVAAARALGASSPRILLRHIAPNLLAPLLVQVTVGFGNVIVAEASLSFLGLGPQVDHTWGAMLDQGTTFLWKPGFHHYAMAAGLAIAWVVLAANLLGDGLRDRLDPRQRGRS